MKPDDDIVVLNDDTPFLEDMEGKDALQRSEIDNATQVTKFATAALPKLLRKAIYLLDNSKNEKTVIESMHFIHKLSQGKVSQKTIDGAVKKMADSELIAELSHDPQAND